MAAPAVEERTILVRLTETEARVTIDSLWHSGNVNRRKADEIDPQTPCPARRRKRDNFLGTAVIAGEVRLEVTKLVSNLDRAEARR